MGFTTSHGCTCLVRVAGECHLEMRGEIFLLNSKGSMNQFITSMGIWEEVVLLELDYRGNSRDQEVSNSSKVTSGYRETVPTREILDTEYDW